MSVFSIKNQEKFKLYRGDECLLPQLPGSQHCKHKLYRGAIKATLAAFMHVSNHGVCNFRNKKCLIKLNKCLALCLEAC